MLITILGPTASGKTKLAVSLAGGMGAEIISGDSRQVYRKMDIGTGKDLNEYTYKGSPVPYHLIDICEPGEKYSVFRFQNDFYRVFAEIKSRERSPILCGGSGLYIEAVVRSYELPDVPPNPALRESLKGKSIAELSTMLAVAKSMHNTSDIKSPHRAIRAIEIEEYRRQHHVDYKSRPGFFPVIIGLDIERDLRRRRISERLRDRLEQGMVSEVQSLLDSGLSVEDVMYYGLEYKFVTLYITGKLNHSEMFVRLETAIHQFAKRQMTWFRGMERRGCTIKWIDASLPLDAQVEIAHQTIANSSPYEH
ncbi:MAG: tRNA (adenosine(37)-N6)-dimethylallyltransferase MiaA [Tannerellaceae bacterium]|jgi:tRNA dimethylallyltransferase|nr:tRNA (adenosine(37)-N6)-dimethylallyltransferase MiaA [Tannerellaceae bacterium]